MRAQRYSGPLSVVSEEAIDGGLEVALGFPASGSEKLMQIEDTLWQRLGELEQREQKAEEQAAQGRPYIG